MIEKKNMCDVRHPDGARCASTERGVDCLFCDDSDECWCSYMWRDSEGEAYCGNSDAISDAMDVLKQVTSGRRVVGTYHVGNHCFVVLDDGALMRTNTNYYGPWEECEPIPGTVADRRKS